MSVSLPNKEEYSKTSGLLQQLATQTEQTLRSVENLINSRELRPQLALESGNHAVDVPETEEVADHDYFETEKTNVGYQQEVYAADLLPEISIEEEGIPPQELIIEIRPNIEFESQGDLEDTNAVPIQPLILGSSLNGKALECLKAWAIKRHTKAVEILNKRVKGNQNNTKAASYYYQKRSFALSLDMVPPKELAWLGQQDAQHQEISLWGHEHSVKVVVIPEDLAVQRPKLQAIIMTHLSELENSAPFQSLELAERKSVLVSGYYYPRLMLVPMSTLKTVLKDVDSRPLNELEEVRLSVGGKNPRIRMVLLDDAPLLASS